MTRPVLRDAAWRHACVIAGVRTAITTLALLVLYVVLPVVGESGVPALIELLIGLAILIVLLVWQARAIVAAQFPMLRAIEALATALVLLIVLFAFTYLSLARAHASSFTQSLDHVDAFYFTVTVLGTVGFGDIAPRGDPARLLVTIQILLDLTLLVGIARVITYAARVGVKRRQGEAEGGDPVTP
jgi:voltage-gated potassium channel